MPTDPELAAALLAAKSAPRLQRVYYGVGEKILASGRRQWWTSPPARVSIRFERVLINSRTSRPFMIKLYGWRIVGGDLPELALDYGSEGAPRAFVPGSQSEWLHPLHFGAHIEPGQSLELDIENATPGRALMARAGLIGVALATDVKRLG